MIFELLHVRLAHPLLDVVMLAATLGLPLIVFGAAAVELKRGDRRGAGLVLVVAFAAGVVAVLLQHVLLRPRPEVLRVLLESPPTPAFPSGHATIAAAVAVLVLLRHRRAGLVFVALAVAVSRIYLGHHYASDVVVGLGIGGAIGALGYGAFHSNERTRPRWSWWLWPQLSVVLFATVAAYTSQLTLAMLTTPGLDKVMHFVLYGALAFLLVSFVPTTKRRALLALAVLATIEEALQALSPSRTFDLGDLACTLGGIGLLGALAVRLTEVRLPSVGERFAALPRR